MPIVDELVKIILEGFTGGNKGKSRHNIDTKPLTKEEKRAIYERLTNKGA